MEPKWSNIICKRVLLAGFTLCVVLGTSPSRAIDIHAEPVVMLEKGATGILRCTFKSSEKVGGTTTVTWSFQSSQPNNTFSKAPYTIFYFFNWTGFPGHEEFKGRVQFVGDLNKRDVSIALNAVQLSDNGTFFCDVKNPPDVTGTPARTELRVVVKESVPQTTAIIVGAVSGALLLLVLVAVVACVVMRMLHSRHEYEGCSSLESASSQAPKPRKKAEPSLEVSRSTGPSGPLQGPVIYAQLDHSGSKHSFHKMEPVVYADIRKN